MKKTLIFMTLVIGLFALMAAPALAGGWWSENLDHRDDASHTIGIYNTAAGFDWSGDDGGIYEYDDMDAPVIIMEDEGGRNEEGKTDGWGYVDEIMHGHNPHGNFATTTNYCKTCHAVHDAGEGSYRLLKNGTDDGTGGSSSPGGPVGPRPGLDDDRSNGEGLDKGYGTLRSNECMYCHDATSGATEARPYALGMVATVRGEHTIGATSIPDSSQSADDVGIAPVGDRILSGNRSTLSNRNPVAYGGVSDTLPILGCYDCHSVHGANTLAAWGGNYILREDPSNDGILVTDVRDGFASDPNDDLADDYMRNNFCADCHNKNASWDDNGSDDRTIKTSHVTGPQANGSLEVYGTTMKVAWVNMDGDDSSGGINERGCRGCHSASDEGMMPIDPDEGAGVATSAWPHQTMESKLLGKDGYDGEQAGNDVAGSFDMEDDPNRPLMRMDEICLNCHSAGGDGTGAWGVGITF